jgi:hypothetical protein
MKGVRTIEVAVAIADAALRGRDTKLIVTQARTHTEQDGPFQPVLLLPGRTPQEVKTTGTIHVTQHSSKHMVSAGHEGAHVGIFNEL